MKKLTVLQSPLGLFSGLCNPPSTPQTAPGTPTKHQQQVSQFTAQGLAFSP